MGKQTGIQKKQTRVQLGNPFPLLCPRTAEAVEKRILELLNRAAKSCGEDTKKTTLRQELVFGVNAVTRNAEQGSLCGVLVTHPVRPQVLCQHLVTLCSHRGLPTLALSQLNSHVAKLFQLSSLMTMGIKKSAESAESPLNPLLQEIKSAALKQTQNVGNSFPLVDLPVTLTVPQVSPPTKSKEAKDFIRLASHPVFPDADYPKELDSLVISVKCSESDLDGRQSPSAERSGIKKKKNDRGSETDFDRRQSPSERRDLKKKNESRTFLLETQLHSVVSSGKVKKKNKIKKSS